MPRLSPIELEILRQSVRPELSTIPAEDLEQVIENSVSELPAASAEDFMKTLSSLGRAVAPVLQRAAPGIAQGAASGATMGGPWGALIGAGAGLASSAFSRPGKTTMPAAPATPVTPAAPATASLPTGQDAAAALFGLLQNRAVQQSLLSQVLGSTGGERVQTSTGVNLPRGAINNLLTQLLANATEALPESESISEQDYLLGESGEYLVDPASPEQQAALVLSHLRSGGTESFAAESDEFADSVQWMAEDLTDSESLEWIEADDSAETIGFY